ncbi:ADP-ribosylation factor-like protein 2 isoform X2 [Desmodus rotundus]|uniref:ADP-ribosylation factor-like protein 2 isoform X2 n=1 Tax=Desmodus rotundus TaxID=9430 RepID=UPI00238126E5|nr:ADP-ribosylation factor-like protein 2 isoform X2 [Desmodus rotundus]
MGLLTILKKKVMQKERELQLLMLDLDNAGKATVLKKKFNGETINTISLTLGFNIKTLEPQGFKLNLWDVGSQKSQHPYWWNYFESTAGLTWVVDSTHLQRMQGCQRELQSLLMEECLALELDSICSHHCAPLCIQGYSSVTEENLLPNFDWLPPG